MATPVDENYVRARSGLLDALAALGPLRDAAVLVGAQAVYEYTRDHAGDYAVSPFTFDADLALIPELVVEDPRVVAAAGASGTYLVSEVLTATRMVSADMPCVLLAWLALRLFSPLWRTAESSVASSGGEWSTSP